jgi:Flp pilus assembly protein TadB
MIVYIALIVSASVILVLVCFYFVNVRARKRKSSRQRVFASQHEDVNREKQPLLRVYVQQWKLLAPDGLSDNEV